MEIHKKGTLTHRVPDGAKSGEVSEIAEFSGTVAGPRKQSNNETQLQKTLGLAYEQLAVMAGYFALVAILSVFPQTRGFVDKMLHIQYVYGDGSRATIGWADSLYVLTGLVLVIGARAAVIVLFIEFLAPFLKITRRKSILRFAEQGWGLLYYGGVSLWGLNLLRRSPYGFDVESMWKNFPHYYITPNVKQYYLLEFAFWISQVYIINVEERRKDHNQMFTHHIITCILVLGSYMHYYTRIGHIIMILMDSVDTLLCAAKCLKYLKCQKLCDFMFILFLISWVVFRHVIYLYEIWYAYFKAPDHFKFKCITPEEGVEVCFNQRMHTILFIMLLLLQGITLIWLAMIVKVVIRVTRGEGADDTRSDDDDD